MSGDVPLRRLCLQGAARAVGQWWSDGVLFATAADCMTVWLAVPDLASLYVPPRPEEYILEQLDAIWNDLRQRQEAMEANIRSMLPKRAPSKRNLAAAIKQIVGQSKTKDNSAIRAVTDGSIVKPFDA